MHSYLRTVGFSKVKSRKEMQEIIQDVINTYDEKIAVENHPDGVFVQYSKNYGCDCGITVCGQYDEDNEFHVELFISIFSRHRNHLSGECSRGETRRKRVLRRGV